MSKGFASDRINRRHGRLGVATSGDGRAETLGEPMSQILQHTVGCLVMVLMLSVVTSASAQSAEELLEQLGEEQRELEKEADWPYERLAQNADTIVIATFESQRTVDRDSLGIEFGDDRTTEGVVSLLNIVAVLKGESDAEQIEVMHLRWKRPVIVLGDISFLDFQSRMSVPTIVQVVTDGHIDQVAASGLEPTIITPEYLLFLQQQEDGRFKPVSGDRFAGRSSRIIND